MGRYSNSKQAYGTSGSPQLSISQYNLYTKIATINEELLIRELESKDTKFNKKEIQFITKDETGQIIWLEKGNNTSGLQHIINRHLSDFKKAYNINESNISNYIKNIISKGKVINTINSKIGYTKVYKYKSKYYLVTGIGHNGYIVSAYPYNGKGGKYEKN